MFLQIASFQLKFFSALEMNFVFF